MNCSSRLSQNMICEIRADCCNQILTRINTDTIHLDILALNSEIPCHQIKKKNTDDVYDFRREIYRWCLSDKGIKIIGQLYF